MIVNKEEVRGYFIGSDNDRKLLCAKCYAEAEQEEYSEELSLTADDLLVEDKMDENLLYFCDECKKKLK